MTINPASPSPWRLAGKRAVITGGTKGIGAAVCKEFQSLGAEVIAVSRNQPEEVEAGVHYVRADLSRAEGRATVLKEVQDRWAACDILINNVGSNIRKPALEYSAQEFQQIFATNLESAFFLSQELYPFLAQGNHPAVVHVSSVAGLTHLRTGVVYGMTKAAMLQMTRNLAVEWATVPIRVNALAPWYVDTPLARAVLDDPDYQREVLARTPLGRIGTPEEVARGIAFLSMEASSWMTGQCLTMDGGFSIYGF